MIVVCYQTVESQEEHSRCPNLSLPNTHLSLSLSSSTYQRGFEETFDDKHTIKLSSAGLIYK